MIDWIANHILKWLSRISIPKTTLFYIKPSWRNGLSAWYYAVLSSIFAFSWVWIRLEDNFFKFFKAKVCHKIYSISFHKSIYIWIRGKEQLEQLPCERFLQDFEFLRAFLPPVSHGSCGTWHVACGTVSEILDERLYVIPWERNTSVVVYSSWKGLKILKVCIL